MFILLYSYIYIHVTVLKYAHSMNKDPPDRRCTICVTLCNTLLCNPLRPRPPGQPCFEPPRPTTTTTPHSVTHHTHAPSPCSHLARHPPHRVLRLYTTHLRLGSQLLTRPRGTEADVALDGQLLEGVRRLAAVIGDWVVRQWSCCTASSGGAPTLGLRLQPLCI